MTTPEEYPRVRPGVWLVLLILGGLGLLHLGAERAWFVGALDTGTTANLGYCLRWAVVGVGYAALATCAWSLLATKPTRKKILLVFLGVSAVMAFGSQEAARRAMKPLVLAINHVRWDPDTQEFTIHAMATPAIARAYSEGKLKVQASVWGYWVKNDNEWGEFAIGPPDLLDRRKVVTSEDFDYSVHRERIVLRVPWKPDRSDYGTVYPEWVGATLTNREGDRVGTESVVSLSKLVFEIRGNLMIPLPLHPR